MTISKSYLAIFLVLLIGVAIIFFYKSCTPSPPSVAKQIDSLKFVIQTDSTQYVARYESWESLRKGLTLSLDSTSRLLDSTRRQFNTQGKQILATNKRLREAFNKKDTGTVYNDCDSLSRALDSIAQTKWYADRELDRQIVLNEQLHTADSIALADCRFTYKKLQGNNTFMQQQYELELQVKDNEVKKAKRKNKLWGGIGFAAREIIRLIFK